jgi:hypothetical protein
MNACFAVYRGRVMSMSSETCSHKMVDPIKFMQNNKKSSLIRCHFRLNIWYMTCITVLDSFNV